LLPHLQRENRLSGGCREDSKRCYKHFMFARHHPKHLKVSPKLLSHVGKVFICTSLLHNRVKAGVELSGRVACLECTGPGFDPSTQTIINTFVQEKFLKTKKLPNYIY
jgi:hypothetical protein